MLHASRDYNARIQDRSGKIPADEPVFLLRGTDPCALPALLAYIGAVTAIDGDANILKVTLKQLKRMQEWQETRGRKYPDMKTDDVV